MEEHTYKLSYMSRIARRILYIGHDNLPKPLYWRLYAIAFSVYKKMVRVFYMRVVLWHLILRQKKQYLKASTIYKIMPYSLVGRSGLSATYDVAKRIEDGSVTGAYVECGVAGGGGAALLGIISEQSDLNRALWLFDSFEGLPNPTTDDYVEGATGVHIRPLDQGSCLGTYEEVEQLLFSKFTLNPSRVSMVKGWFQDTLPANKDSIGDIAVLRIDGDWYESTKCCLENLYDNVVTEGVVIIDDYWSCFGAKKATDEFIATKGLKVEIVDDGSGGCYFTK